MTNKTEIKSLLIQVKEIATQLKEEITGLDDQIDALYVEHSILLGMPLSKEDYLSAVRADVQRRAKLFKGYLKQSIKAGRKVDYPLIVSEAPMMIPYLSGGIGNYSHELQEGGYYFYFEDAIVAGIERIMGDELWPLDAMPAAERKTALAAIEAKVSTLTRRRDALANDLVSTGVTK